METPFVVVVIIDHKIKGLIQKHRFFNMNFKMKNENYQKLFWLFLNSLVSKTCTLGFSINLNSAYDFEFFEVTFWKRKKEENLYKIIFF